MTIWLQDTHKNYLILFHFFHFILLHFTFALFKFYTQLHLSVYSILFYIGNNREQNKIQVQI